MNSLNLLQSTRDISRTIVECGKNDRLVILQFTTDASYSTWKVPIIAAIKKAFEEDGHSGQVIDIEAKSDEKNPSNEVARRIGQGAKTIAEAMKMHASSMPMILRLQGEHTSRWMDTLRLIADCYENSQGQHLCPTVVFYQGPESSLSRICQHPRVEVLHFWNAIRWEEMRLLAHSWLRTPEDSLKSLWYVATYVGASNGDLNVLKKLCEDRPRSLSGIRLMLSKMISVGGGAVAGTPIAITSTRWSVPQHLMSDWQKGAVLGMNVERGILAPHSDIWINSQFDTSIWREQCTGLLPPLLELGFQLYKRAASILNINEECSSRSNENCTEWEFPEPGKIVSTINRRHSQIYEEVYSLFDYLRQARNKLAHLKPVDYPRIDMIHMKAKEVISLLDRHEQSSSRRD